MIAFVAAVAVLAGTGTGTRDAACVKEARPAQARSAAVDAAYARAEAHFLGRLDEVGLVGSTLAREKTAGDAAITAPARSAKALGTARRPAPRRAAAAARLASRPTN